MWERACSRMRCVSQRKCRLIYRIREQARSHIFYCISSLGLISPLSRTSNPKPHARVARRDVRTW
ncbi:hypothetical protein DCC84_31935 [Pseudomonas sp. SXM-1]|nr:hypothetical protein DCC84_31935 [Pseudomonas sp. SXM-1]